MNATEVFDVLLSVMAEILSDFDASQVSPESTFEDLGANSVDRVNIISDAMDDTETYLPMVRFAGHHTVASVAELIAQAATSSSGTEV